jgi:hypothetical protein
MSFGACEVQCWRWFFGKKTLVSQTREPTAERNARTSETFWHHHDGDLAGFGASGFGAHRDAAHDRVVIHHDRARSYIMCFDEAR